MCLICTWYVSVRKWGCQDIIFDHSMEVHWQCLPLLAMKCLMMEWCRSDAKLGRKGCERWKGLGLEWLENCPKARFKNCVSRINRSECWHKCNDILYGSTYQYV